jgi:hypothetical protein
MGGDMTGDEFALLLRELTRSAESGDGARFANHFTEDAIYYDFSISCTAGSRRSRPSRSIDRSA